MTDALDEERVVEEFQAAKADGADIAEAVVKVAEALGGSVNPRRLKTIAYQHAVYEPDFDVRHIDGREDVVSAAAECQTVLELARELRVETEFARRWARWCGVRDELESTSDLLDKLQQAGEQEQEERELRTDGSGVRSWGDL